MHHYFFFEQDAETYLSSVLTIVQVLLCYGQGVMPPLLWRPLPPGDSSFFIQYIIMVFWFQLLESEKGLLRSAMMQMTHTFQGIRDLLCIFHLGSEYDISPEHGSPNKKRAISTILNPATKPANRAYVLVPLCAIQLYDDVVILSPSSVSRPIRPLPQSKTSG